MGSTTTSPSASIGVTLDLVCPLKVIGVEKQAIGLSLQVRLSER